MMEKTLNLEQGSFRDPSGFVFYKNGKVLRQVNKSYKNDFKLFVKSGLYKKLLENKLIISFKRVNNSNAVTADVYCMLEVQKIPFLSYPYEWSFSQLKDAAQATLKIQKIAMEHGMSLKDASAYNIQFHEGKPILIDILSFEKYKEGAPWVAYRQFCQHFLAPLSLMSYRDYRLGQLLKTYIDGIPLDLASKLLPKRTLFDFSLASHIHLHAKTQKRFADVGENIKKYKINVSRTNLLSIIDSLNSKIKNLELKTGKTEWGDYYSFTNYSQKSFSNKKNTVAKFLDLVSPKTVWDLGANTGEFSKIAAQKGIYTISFDSDFLAVEKNYIDAKKSDQKNILPLVLDLTNPSPSIGWANKERKSLIERGPADCIVALALIHHLAISNNLPFDNIARFLKEICRSLIIEFVPKEDSQVKKLLSTREDIFTDYNKISFEKAFSKYFEIIRTQKIIASERTIYCMLKRQ